MWNKLENSYLEERKARSICDYFNPKMGALGGAMMAATVFYINSDYGVASASVAAVKQGAYTFLVGSFIVGICENVSRYYENSKLSKAMSVVVPSVVTVGLTYLVHSVKGTPEPLESTLPTVLLGPPAFAYIGIRNRNKLDKILEELDG